MTTPEALKARQQRTQKELLVVGILLVILAVALVYVTWTGNSRNDRQDACISTEFDDLSTALAARGAIAQRESKAARLEGRAAKVEGRAAKLATKFDLDFYEQAFDSTTSEGFLAAYGDLRERMGEVTQLRNKAAAMRFKVENRRQRIKEDRAANPIPDFPEGTCVGDTETQDQREGA